MQNLKKQNLANRQETQIGIFHLGIGIDEKWWRRLKVFKHNQNLSYMLRVESWGNYRKQKLTTTMNKNYTTEG